MASFSSQVRTLTRPVITLGLAGAFVYAVLEGNTEAAQVLGPTATMAIGFWFSDRAITKEAQNVEYENLRFREAEGQRDFFSKQPKEGEEKEPVKAIGLVSLGGGED